MHEFLKALKNAFPHTISILLGYLLMGMTFGMLLAQQGYDYKVALFMSLFIYAGAVQFVAITLLSAQADLMNVVIVSLLVNARQTCYALSMLDRFKNTKWRLPYLAHTLSDETFALLNLYAPKEGVNEKDFIFSISLLNHSYWVIGSLIGSLAGSHFSFDTQGMGFVMTAIFIVLFMEQYKRNANHKNAWLGVLIAVVCLALFGSQYFLLFALVSMLLALIFFKKQLEC
ncbi:azaleucine resistance protein AzlC [Helicobacter pylori]|uniref:azaleucine resistance protein AzlC n=1 Tax=Helicobacter pylori TaxID=210 RepID=UPI00165BC368|nr:azaleucine resistance protein AzlC [Helicobacter pylori]WQS20739.1 azaleucine resistance protein AzlC [Helicobacter pylori]WQS30081.1 azaleucine resistance protein AzlC [Helicobacter pylori]